MYDCSTVYTAADFCGLGRYHQGSCSVLDADFCGLGRYHQGNCSILGADFCGLGRRERRAVDFPFKF